MREMDGFELYDKLRKMDNNINVCFLTAAQEYYDKYKERYSSEECFITKPIALKNLVNTIKFTSLIVYVAIVGHYSY